MLRHSLLKEERDRVQEIAHCRQRILELRESRAADIRMVSRICLGREEELALGIGSRKFARETEELRAVLQHLINVSAMEPESHTVISFA